MSTDPEAPREAGGPCFRLVLEYDGTDFAGWQEQRHEAPRRVERTVQGVLNEVAASITGQPVRSMGAGRTDAGVHAEGQVASLRVETSIPAADLGRALNARLPRDVAVVEAREAAADYDARRAAVAKHYRYRIWNARRPSPLRARQQVWIREALDLEAMQKSLPSFQGRHDFRSLQAAGSSVKTTERTILALALRGVPGGEVVLDVVGDGFLRHMVRNLAGSLLEIGAGRRSPGWAEEMLSARDRSQAGPTAPAHGLCLVAVQEAGTAPLALGLSSGNPDS